MKWHSLSSSRGERNAGYLYLSAFIFYPLLFAHQVPFNSIYVGKYLLDSYYSTIIILDSILVTSEVIERRVNASVYFLSVWLGSVWLCERYTELQKFKGGTRYFYLGNQESCMGLGQVLQLAGAFSVHQRVVGTIPGLDTYLSCGFNPWLESV